MWRDDYDRNDESHRGGRGGRQWDRDREQDEYQTRGREGSGAQRGRYEEEDRWAEERGRRGGRSGSEAYRGREGGYGEGRDGQYGRGSEGYGASSGVPYTSQADGGGARGSREFGGSAQDRSNLMYGSENLQSYEQRQDFTGRGPKAWKRSDQRIEEDLNEQLTRHRDIDATDIEVKVHAGEVTLAGTVTDRQFKRLAEDIAENVSGVHNVQNQIRVSPSAGSYETSSQTTDARNKGSKTTM